MCVCVCVWVVTKIFPWHSRMTFNPSETWCLGLISFLYMHINISEIFSARTIFVEERQ